MANTSVQLTGVVDWNKETELMTEYFTVIVHRAGKFRVAIVPVRAAGAFSGASWAEQDGRIFEADTDEAARSYVGQLSDRHWSGIDVIVGSSELVADVTASPAANASAVRKAKKR